LRIVQKTSVGELLLYKSDSREPLKKCDYMPKKKERKKKSAYVKKKVMCS
jgi:hypothetical protein